MRYRQLILGSMALAVVAGCGNGRSARDKIADVSADVAEFAAAATGQKAPLADRKNTGHLGFDTGNYPGDKAMLAWRTGGAPYEWTGYYLPSPCHPDEGWSGKRDTLTRMGYGLAVVYVGQQTWGRTPGAPHLVPMQVSRRVKETTGRVHDCGADRRRAPSDDAVLRSRPGVTRRSTWRAPTARSGRPRTKA